MHGTCTHGTCQDQVPWGPSFAMAWRGTVLPLFSPHGCQGVRPCGCGVSASMIPCPQALVQQLAANGLQVCDSTVADGNCGVHAFVIGLVQQTQMHRTTHRLPAVTELCRSRESARLGAARQAGVSWLRKNVATELWEGMSVRGLCRVVSGKSFEAYIASMQKGGTWADTTLIHAMGCSFGVDVCIFQPDQEPTLLGTSLHNGGPDGPLLVPVALANDLHFWGVLEEKVEDELEFIDKGDPWPLQAPAKRKREPGSCSDDEGEDPKAFMDHPWQGENDQALSPEQVEKELALCHALGRWDPWESPTDELLHAMQVASRSPESRQGCTPQPSATVWDRVGAALARSKAIEALAYEEAHFDVMPEALKYQRSAKLRLLSASKSPARLSSRGQWTRTYLEARCSMLASREIEKMLDQACPKNPEHQCMAKFTPEHVLNWRSLWWSLPKVIRKEHLLRTYCAHFETHQKQGRNKQTWKMCFSFLGIRVCREAFMKLTGLGTSSLQDARQGTLDGKTSWVSRAELGLALSIRNTSKAKAYLAARQWLEVYASSHAEMSPMKLEAYLPQGRKMFYWHQYIYEQGLSAPKGQVLSGGAKGVHLELNHPVASYPLFLQAWRVEVPWLIICKSVSMFVRCGVCEYLKLMIEQTPRNQEPLRQALKDRLGSHFRFQSAQRLAQGRVEEECAQSGGSKWFMKIDKMDQKKAVTPTVWSQLATPLFKDLDRRLVTGLIGSMWHGTVHTTHHLRTVFEDCQHGSEMQCSAVLMNLHYVALQEGHLPERFHIGADNTYKETKNQTMIWFLVWLLCVLDSTRLWSVQLLFLLVGHTHDALDRFFSRVVAALAGHDFFTVPEMFRVLGERLQYCHLQWGHLSQTWGWKELQALGHPLHGLGQVHAVEIFRSKGVYIKWKQWMTDEEWSSPVLLVSEQDMQPFAAFRPNSHTMQFPNQGQPILQWISKFEHWCFSQPALQDQDLSNRLAWVRQAVRHEAPGVYAPGASVAALVEDLLRLPEQCQPRSQPALALPQDHLSQLFPGSDVPPIPVDSLLRVEGVTHVRGKRVKSDLIVPGSLLVVRVPEGTQVHGHPVPFLVAVAMQTPSLHTASDKLLVAWWLPSLSKAETFRAGKKREVVDLFGTWASFDEHGVESLRKASLPDPLVNVDDLLEWNFEWGADRTLPYETLDVLREQHGIDITGLNMSLTHKGNLYRSYALMRGRQ